jgi:hypothetical protein
VNKWWRELECSDTIGLSHQKKRFYIILIMTMIEISKELQLKRVDIWLESVKVEKNKGLQVPSIFL